MKEEDLIKTLYTIKKHLDENNIENWLDAGTLLGAVREKRFLPWDYDIDIGAKYSDIDNILNVFEDIDQQGYNLCYFPLEKIIKILGKNSEIDINLYEFKEKEATRKWYINNKKGEMLDYLRWILTTEIPNLKRGKMPKIVTKSLMTATKILPDSLKEKLASKIMNIYEKTGCKIVHLSIPAEYFTDLSQMKFYDLTVKVPAKTTEYLEYRYGKDWRTPKKDYVYYKDDQSIVK